MRDRDHYPRCWARTVFWPDTNPRPVQCQLPRLHVGAHTMWVAEDTTYEWTDDELPTTYPTDASLPIRRKAQP